MASRRYTSQFSYSFERFLVNLCGNFQQSGSTGAFATLTLGGVSYTAVTMGAGGNSITVAYTGGGTAGSEVVSVSGNAISVQIQSGTSTITQVRTAVNASPAAAALVTASGTSSSTVATHAASPLTGGISTLFISSMNGGGSLSQTGTGIFQLNIPDNYQSLQSMSVMLSRSSGAVDLKPQLGSISLSSAPNNSIQIRMLAVATPTNLSSGDVLLIAAGLRNSSS